LENLVILGEAGMGKTRLLEELADQKVKFVSAQRLINAPDPEALLAGHQCVLIDALDEATSYKRGEAINAVLSQLEKSGVARFILSCRVEDWQEATAVSLIKETFGEPPLELTLKPFDSTQVRDFLAEQLGVAEAEAAVSNYHDRGLAEWLGNPQTLIMLGELLKQGRHPNSTSELFSDYVDLSLPEANRARRTTQKNVSSETRKDILGAAFAALIMSGKTAIAKLGAPFDEENLPLAQLSDLPGEIDWEAVSGNRLVRSYYGNPDRLTYSHRRVGEWLAARWLAKQAQSAEVRDRLMAAIVINGIVPASLRGLFGWLAAYQPFAEAVISTDPMAVVEYGDADVLPERSARELLSSLDKMAAIDPYFAGWSQSRAKALVRRNLLQLALTVMGDRTKSARLRLLLAQQFRGEALPADETAQLRAMVMDLTEFYALREELAEAVIPHLDAVELRAMVKDLSGQGAHDSMRLASRVILEAGFDHFDDEQIVQTVMADCGHTICRVPDEGEDRLAAKTWRFRREIPDNRLEGILDALADYAQDLLPEYRSIESSEVINLGEALISRRLQLGPVSPDQLLKWLKAFSGRDSFDEDDRRAIFEFLRGNAEIRQAVQKLWLEDGGSQEDFFLAAHRLHELNQALALGDDDLAAFLKSIPESFPYWREAVRLIRHDQTNGQCTRDAARRFSASDEEHRSFVQELLNPPKPDWQLRQEERTSRWEAERIERWTEFREGMQKNEEFLRQGRFGLVLQAANVYFARFSDLRELNLEERMNALCGADMIPAVREGFEAFLNRLPPYPHAQEIAQSYAESKGWNAQYILLAGLAERLRATGSLDPIDNDQLVSAQLHSAHQALYGDEWNSLREAIWKRLTRDASAFERYARLLVEPSLGARREIIMGLSELLRDGMTAYPQLLESLVSEWLGRFQELHHRPEAELIDALLSRGKCELLTALASQRLQKDDLDDERRRNWQAVDLLCDFEAATARITPAHLNEPELFWAIRERAGARRPYDDAAEKFSTDLAAWMATNFRKTFPNVGRPQGVTSGDQNPWDGTEAITRLIDRVGADPSSRAGEHLKALAAESDGYQERALAVLAEHRRNKAERERVTLSVSALANILSDGPPQTSPDLRTRMLQVLDRVEAQARSSPTDSWVNFYRDNGKTPHDEERCRDRLIEMLQQHEQRVRFSPEKHLGDDREGDIACEIDALHLPIEVKGQWHDDLWSAADKQLAAQQACDHRAGGYGILLVLWFGANGKPLKGPPRGSGIRKPTTPHELEQALSEHSEAAKSGRITVKVVDLSRG
jgi:hypothetical protein